MEKIWNIYNNGFDEYREFYQKLKKELEEDIEYVLMDNGAINGGANFKLLHKENNLYELKIWYKYYGNETIDFINEYGEPIYYTEAYQYFYTLELPADKDVIYFIDRINNLKLELDKIIQDKF